MNGVGWPCSLVAWCGGAVFSRVSHCIESVKTLVDVIVQVYQYKRLRFPIVSV